MPEPSSFSLFLYFKQGGIAMYPLLLCSVLTVAVGLERAWVLLRAVRTDAVLADRLRGMLSSRRVEDATKQCDESDSPLAHVVQEVVTSPKAGAAHREKTLQRALTRETGRLERNMPILATIGSVSPFIGLFGTVLGIMRAFHDIGVSGSAGGAVVAAGIAEALITTAAGLFVAVVAVVAYNHLMTWVQNTITQTELSAEELVMLLDE
jgi:biopolymer transport protein ExbB/TolQ